MSILLTSCAGSLYSEMYHPIDEQGLGYQDSFYGPGFEFYVQAFSESPHYETEMIALLRVSELCQGKFKVTSIVTEITINDDGKNNKLPSQSRVIAKCLE